MTEHQLTWRASPAALALTTCAAVALTAGVVGRWWELIVFAAPMLGALGTVTWLPRPATGIRVEASARMLRCFESESVHFSVDVTVCGGAAELEVAPTPSDGYTVEQIGDGDYVVSADRWGRYEPALTVTARAGGGLLTASLPVPVAELRVFPLAPPCRLRCPTPHFRTGSARTAPADSVRASSSGTSGRTRRGIRCAASTGR